VIFTGVGEGPKYALEHFCKQEAYSNIRIIAVTFPYGMRFKDGEQREISREDQQLLEENNVKIVRAHMPFNPIAAHHPHHGILGQDLTLIGNALSIMGGSMSLCVQAALMACDAGHIELGEHVIALTSDTAILVRTAPTERLLTDFIAREILCKPLSLTISKKEHKLSGEPKQLTLEALPNESDRNLPEPK
jgi:hypothetical protein